VLEKVWTKRSNQAIKLYHLHPIIALACGAQREIGSQSQRLLSLKVLAYSLFLLLSFDFGGTFGQTFVGTRAKSLEIKRSWRAGLVTIYVKYFERLKTESTAREITA
jgi:hypothetical protein